MPELGLDRFIELRVLDRRVKRRRSRCKAERRDGKYLASITDTPREWMSQEFKAEEDRMRDFASGVRSTLPRSDVTTHLMIRDDCLTYDQAAKKLRIPKGRVHARMKNVHQAFRAALSAIGVERPTPRHGGRPAHPSRQATRTRRRDHPTSHPTAVR